MRRFIIIFFLVAVAVAAVVVANLRRDPSRFGVDWRIKKNLPTKEVRVEQPRRATIVQTVTAPGTIELIEEADIASQIVGKVQAVCVQKGDRVRQGDLLVKLDDEDAKARLASTEARIERLKAAIELAEADLEKARVDSAGYHKLAERGYSSPNEVRDGETILAKMVAALDMSQQELKETFAIHRNSQQEVERTEIRSPMDGTVIHLDVEEGEVVIAGTTNLPGTVLMTIGDMSRMRVRADVYESDVGLLRPLQPARIYLQADQAVPLPGAVDLISPKGTRLGAVVSFETLINLDGQHESVRPEMTATVEIEVNRADDVMSLPVQAVVYRRYRDLPQTALFRDWLANQPVTPAEKGKDLAIRYVKVVFVMVDGIAHARPVATGISDQDRIEIRDGLSPEDTVIVGPFRALDEMEDGQPVKLEEVPPEATDSKKSEAKPSSPPDQTPEASTASDDETGGGP